MQALRKPSVEQATVSVDAAEPSVRTPGDRRAPRLPADQAAALSPALGLREQLTTRLEDLARQTGPADAAILAEPFGEKLPVPVRVAVILGLSVSLWLVLGLAIAAVM